MITFESELNEMVADKNLMNSYKLFFLKTIILNASNIKKEFDFYELACWMCAYSFRDVCSVGNRLRPLDKLYDAAVLIIEKEGLMESSNVSEVFDAAYNTRDKELRRLISSLCNYVPYRLLAYLWPVELSGKTDRQKNHTIEELSRGDSKSVYAIFSISQVNKRIEMKSDWLDYIMNNRQTLIPWIDQRIDSFVWRK